MTRTASEMISATRSTSRCRGSITQWSVSRSASECASRSAAGRWIATQVVSRSIRRIGGLGRLRSLHSVRHLSRLFQRLAGAGRPPRIEQAPRSPNHSPPTSRGPAARFRFRPPPETHPGKRSSNHSPPMSRGPAAPRFRFRPPPETRPRKRPRPTHSPPTDFGSPRFRNPTPAAGTRPSDALFR